MKKTLVTGATGFIGGKLLERLIKTTAGEIVLLIRPGTARSRYARFEEAGARIEAVAMTDHNAIEHLFNSYRFDVVYHIAAIRGGRPFSWQEYFSSNVMATEYIAREVAKQEGRLVFCSSVGVFGAIPRKLPADELTPRQRDNYYHYTKIVAEERLRLMVADGLEVIIIRPVITYGTDDYGFPYSLIKLIDSKMFIHCTRDVKIHLGDVQVLVEAFIRAAEVNVPSGSAYIVADREPVHLRALVDLINHHLKNQSYPQWKKLPGVAFDLASFTFDKLVKSDLWKARFQLISKSWYYDIGPTQRDLKITLADTLDRFSYVVDWYLNIRET
jgi:nucleoside-diphosphate-sugar epimerase